MTRPKGYSSPDHEYREIPELPDGPAPGAAPSTTPRGRGPVAIDPTPTCGAWPQYGGCVLPSHHNLGYVDIPSNHKFPERAEGDDPYMAHIKRLEKEIEAIRKAFGLLVVSAAPAVKWLDATMEAIKKEDDK